MTHSADIGQLTIRGIAGELAVSIRALAEREGLSLNQAVLRLLREATGLARAGVGRPAQPIGDAAREWAGTWSAALGKQIDAAVTELDRMDAEHGW